MKIALCLSNHIGIVNNIKINNEKNDRHLKKKDINDSSLSKEYLENQVDPQICFNSIKKHLFGL